MVPNLNSYSETAIVNRARLLQLLQAGVWTESHRFARQAALSWLAAYPGDLEVMRWAAAIFTSEGKIAQARKILEKILKTDPEDIESLTSFLVLLSKDTSAYDITRIRLHALGAERIDHAPAWADALRNFHTIGEKTEQEKYLELKQLLLSTPDEIILALEHVRMARAQQDTQTVVTLAQRYQRRWPSSLLIGLALADGQMLLGREAEAVNLLHRCATEDAGGQVAEKLWGKINPYQVLWPKDMSIVLPVPVPSAIKYWLGEAGLPEGQNQHESEENDECIEPSVEELVEEASGGEDVAGGPEIVLEIESSAVNNPKQDKEGIETGTSSGLEKAFARIAKQMKRTDVSTADGRYPVYVIFSTYGGLTNKYGAATTKIIQQEIERLAKAVKARTDWGAVAFMPDDVTSCEQFGLLPVPPTDPWKLKLSLVDLDKYLAKAGQRIGALVIIGGSDVVPFHRLPNPVDDVDPEVLSDNPYATLDSNYFIPTWPVGRIPGEAGSDAGLLIQQLRTMVKYHQDNARKVQEENNAGGTLYHFWRSVFQRALTAKSVGGNVGYSASVWKRASVAVYRAIGATNSIMISPPMTTDSFNGNRLPAATFSYFNLHGMEDSPEWYGQRDATDPVGVDYPIAFKPKDIGKGNKVTKIVFSEACYGGYVNGKTEATSIALRFLSIGAAAVVGSTCVSYGSVGLPLIAADLLASLFWRYTKEGFATGDALVHAKIGLAREMTKKQGFLDGEDQKTLISFVLYGDPLMAYEAYNGVAKRILRSKQPINVKTICDRDMKVVEAGVSTNMPRVNETVIQQVKELAAQYLPGPEKVDVRISQPKMKCDGADHQCPTSQLKAAQHTANPDQSVVVLSKQIQIAQHCITTYMRVTLDKRGNPIKMVISK